MRLDKSYLIPLESVPNSRYYEIPTLSHDQLYVFYEVANSYDLTVRFVYTPVTGRFRGGG